MKHRLRRPSLLTGLVSTLLLGACGHPATEVECDEIVERIARLELEKRKLSAESISQEIDGVKANLRETTMKDCVGKRITGSAMECVRQAKTSDEVVNECFN